jgi:hypothetical protein
VAQGRPLALHKHEQQQERRRRDEGGDESGGEADAQTFVGRGAPVEPVIYLIG